MSTSQTTTFKELTTSERNALTPPTFTLVFDTDLSQWFVWNGSSWVSSTSSLSVGTYDSQSAVADGLQIISSVLYAQSADATHPGMVNTTTQTFAGAKTFSSAPTITALTASQAVVTDSSKVLSSLAYTPNPTVSTIVSRDSSGNARAVNWISGATNVVSAAGTTVLTAASTRLQQLTGTAIQTFQLPDATTLAVGATYDFNNNSTAALTVTNNGGSTICTIPGGGCARVTAIAVSTANGSWDFHGLLPSTTLPGTGGGTTNFLRADGTWAIPTGASGITALTGDVTASGPGSAAASLVATSNATLTTLSALTTASALASVGTITSGVWSGTNIAATKGGTGTGTYTTGDILYASATNTLSKLSIGTAGQVLTVASGLPSWGTNVGNLSVVSKTANYNITTADDVILCAAGTPFQVTLPSAVGNSGKTFYIKKTDASVNAVTIGTTSSQTIDGALTYAMTLQFEEMTVVSDGSNWQVIDETNTNNITKLPSLATVGTIGTGVWQGSKVAEGFGGTNQSTYTTGDILYASASNTLSKLGKGSANQRLGILGSQSTPSWLTEYQFQYPNYIAANPDAEVDTTGWATYSDGASNIPVDGTGGTATNLTFSRSTSSPLRGTGQFSMVQANSTSLQGKGVSYDFTIDNADKAKVLAIMFDFNASTTFVASNGTTAPLNDGTVTTNAGNSDIEVFIYDVTNSALIYVSPQVITGNGANNFNFKGSFQTASNSTSYRLILHIATASANATGWTFLFDNTYVGRTPVLYGPPITDWTNSLSVTPNNFGTVTTTSYWTRREGDTLQVRGVFTCGTTVASTCSISNPSGFSIDSSKMNAAATMKVGQVWRLQSASTVFAGSSSGPFPLFWDGSTTGSVFPATVTVSNIFAKVNGSGIASSNDVMAFEYAIPIAGWSSTLLMSNDTDTRVVTATYTNNAGVSSGSTPITNGWSKVTDTHSAFNTSTGVYTVPVSGNYQVLWNTSVQGAGSQADILKNGSTFVNGLGSGARGTVNITIPCVAGDTLTPVEGSSTTMSANNTSTSFSITRVSGPSAIASTESINMRYYSSSSSVSGSLGTVTYATKDYDSHSAYSSGVYTVPASGKYEINVALLVTGTIALNNNLIVEIQKNNVVVSRFTEFFPATLTDGKATMSDLINCVAGDTLRIQASSTVTGPSIVSSNFDNYLSIFRQGN